MELKKFFIVAFALPSFVVTTAIAANKFSDGSFLRRNTNGEPFTTTLDENDTPSALTNDFQEGVNATVYTDIGNPLTFSFSKARKSSGAFRELAPKGMIYNFGSEAGALPGMFAVTAYFTGETDTLRVRTMQTNSTVGTTCAPIELVSGQRTLIPSSRYLSFVAGESGNIIQSIKIECTCQDVVTPIEKLNGTYTGVGNGGYSWSMTLNNGAVALTSTDKVSNTELNGTATFDGTTLQCTFDSPSAYNGLVYNLTASSEFSEFAFSSKSGTGSDSFPDIDFYRVYDIEAFEGYDRTGRGWDISSGSASTQYSTTGARAAYICEYKKNDASSGPIGGEGWSLMGSTDYMVFNNSKGMDNSKTIAFKCGQNQMRFFHLRGYYGIPSFIGKGSVFSFWARGPYQTTNLELDSAYSGNITIHAFYTTKVSSSTVNQCTSETFYVNPGSDWEEYTMDLDPTKEYYSFCIETKSDTSNAATRYIPIDNIKIYTVTPYEPEEFTTISGNFHGYATKSSKAGGNCPIALALGSDGNGDTRIDGVDYPVSTYTYNESTGEISITVENDPSSWGRKYIGTITGTYNKRTNTITNFAVSGSKKSEWSDNGSITLEEPEHTWHCDGHTNDLRRDFVRRYYDGNHHQSDINYNDDRILCTDEHYIGGGHAMKIRPYQSGGVGFALAQDFATPLHASAICFWVYNPTNSTITVRVRICKQPNFGDITEESALIGTATVGPNSWDYRSIGFTAADIYNFQVLEFDGNHSSGAAITYDNISIH